MHAMRSNIYGFQGGFELIDTVLQANIYSSCNAANANML